MIELFLPVIPPKTTSQQKRLVVVKDKPRFFHNKKHQEAESDLLTLMKPYSPSKPLSGALQVVVTLTYPWRKSEPMKHRLLGKKPMTSKPDCDNVVKLINDCMTKLLFFGDDAQIYSLFIQKYWGDKPGIFIRIQETLS